MTRPGLEPGDQLANHEATASPTWLQKLYIKLLVVKSTFFLLVVYLISVLCPCSCQPGVQGEKCTECMDGYKNFSSSGCTPCNCDGNGSLSEVCDKVSHQCPCKVSKITLCSCTAVKVSGTFTV